MRLWVRLVVGLVRKLPVNRWVQHEERAGVSIGFLYTSSIV
jgi:hypothetical protein